MGGLNSVFDIAGTGMSAQSVRLNTTASNLANADSASSSIDTTYRARQPVFSAIHQEMLQGGMVVKPEGGVEVLGIVESQDPLQKRYEPHHPMADVEGYVSYPNVSVVDEMANMMSASHSFQANVEMLNTVKSMISRVLTLGQ
jgi:flagellar basal-body rod protein FlgC